MDPVADHITVPVRKISDQYYRNSNIDSVWMNPKGPPTPNDSATLPGDTFDFFNGLSDGQNELHTHFVCQRNGVINASQFEFEFSVSISAKNTVCVYHTVFFVW